MMDDGLDFCSTSQTPQRTGKQDFLFFLRPYARYLLREKVSSHLIWSIARNGDRDTRTSDRPHFLSLSRLRKKNIIAFDKAQNNIENTVL